MELRSDIKDGRKCGCPSSKLARFQVSESERQLPATDNGNNQKGIASYDLDEINY
jgi:hypothetical protein